MDNSEKYLTEGEQTKLSASIEKIGETLKEQGLDLVLEILDWLGKNLKETRDKKEKTGLFRKRTAEEIINSEMATGCTDYALAFISLARARKIPTKYVEAIRNKWLDLGDENFLEGHVFAECFINNKWHIVDPYEGDIKTNYRRFKILGEGLDSWDIGIKNFNDLKEKFLDFKKKHNHQKTA